VSSLSSLIQTSRWMCIVANLLTPVVELANQLDP